MYSLSAELNAEEKIQAGEECRACVVHMHGIQERVQRKESTFKQVTREDFTLLEDVVLFVCLFVFLSER